MSEHSEPPPEELLRTRDFRAAGPVELDLSNGVGPVEVELDDSESVHVEVRHEPEHGYPDWRGGLSGLLNWVSEQFNETGIKPGNGRGNGGGREGDRALNAAAEAVHQTRVDMTNSRVAVHPPTTVPLRSVPLAVRVRAPSGSRVNTRTGPGSIRIAGRAGRMSLQSGSGSVLTDEASGTATVRTGSGLVRLGRMAGGVQARSGSGRIEIASIEAASSVVTGSGSVWLGSVGHDLLVRSGSGDITVAEGTSGQVELITGSGELQFAVGRGVAAEVDLTSSTGSITSELEVATEPPATPPPLRLFGRTGSGQALLTSAV
ncbi:hypothetical protein SAMN04487905_104175 [Actinopolyspora xinjiangensis]|uniref:DUF4097 domain-containing protein n=1 Tax=Actinopolyspora xinjiangensis TaxID=405564 RepID=A0A1H0SU84_9ACTN|nr:DUF4097 family beta strand repeat-containing protein [Actinopolyspora xinjiangensis]SDP45352.1 hypothetical protein SAMN04487905_104175 [Actinopolyspora xinjiangensis]